jgi:LasA protease
MWSARPSIEVSTLSIEPPPTEGLPPTITSAPPEMPANEMQGTPTPDPIREPPAMRTEEESYQVLWGDSLNKIAAKFQVSSFQIMQANEIANPDLLAVGQWLAIPVPHPQEPGPPFKIIPDSELVYGPASIFVDVPALVEQGGGYLREYSEDIDGEVFTGSEIVTLVSQRYSVNPLLLLALLEYQSGWLTERSIPRAQQVYPMGFVAPEYEWLFSQLSWTADQLNMGYYRWRAGWAGPYVMTDGIVINPGPGINAGTAGVEHLFSLLYPGNEWRGIVGEDGFFQKYLELFGNPFARQVVPLLPDDLVQPELQLPFEAGKVWSFTGGPHSAWHQGAAWGALDFAPPGDAYGCVWSDEWATAAGEGVIVRTGDGDVLLDLDADGYEQTGWVILYMHVESSDRVPAGAYVRAGDLIGHPSCEGGLTTGTHIHIARKYNGEWIPADAEIPFVLDGWVSTGAGQQYDGLMVRDGESVEACACRNDENQIAR